MTDDGKERQVTIDFEPFRPINTSLYLCDNKFHVEALSELLEDDQKFGFIVMDGNGCLFGTVFGNTREVIHKLSVELPKKHGRGGQSALRFARLRLEKRHNYLAKVAELCTQLFITENRINVTGLVLAGSAEFKNDLQDSDLFDARLKSKARFAYFPLFAPLLIWFFVNCLLSNTVSFLNSWLCQVLKVVDVSYGGENGFNQAIELSSDALSNIKFVQEKKLIQKYFDQINQDSGRFCFGVDDTMKALDMGACETLICWESLEVNRYVIKNDVTGEAEVFVLTPEKERDSKYFRNAETGVDKEVLDKQSLTEYFANEYKTFGELWFLHPSVLEPAYVHLLFSHTFVAGTSLEFVTDRSQEGMQFRKGFGGIGGILRYRVDFSTLAGDHVVAGDDVGSDFDDNFDDFDADDFDFGL
jgi:peptide chain release factor subunit 1